MASESEFHQFVERSRELGLTVRPPTPFSLHSLPIVNLPFPLMAVASSWKPVLMDEYPNLNRYVTNRFSMTIDKDFEASWIPEIVGKLQAAVNLGTR